MKPRRPTFREILDQSRVETAAAAWERARLASRLRRSLALLGKPRSARLLGALKACCLDRVADILPGEVRVKIDSDFQIGLVSVRWPGHGRLHLPAGSLSNRIA
jgi:hypothetical protein